MRPMSQRERQSGAGNRPARPRTIEPKASGSAAGGEAGASRSTAGGEAGASGSAAAEPERRSPEFMERAMNTFGAAVYRLALNQTRSPHDAEDVSQDVFLRLLRDRTRFADDGQLKAWLLRVTINRCLEIRRSAWRRRAVIGADDDWAAIAAIADADPTGNPEARALADLARSPVWNAMMQLPEAWRLAVHLHHVEGYSTEEVAQLTHCKATTVRTRLHRARKRLREILEQQKQQEQKTPRPAKEVASDDRSNEPAQPSDPSEPTGPAQPAWVAG